MTVYVVVDNWDEFDMYEIQQRIIGVYSNKEKAKEALIDIMLHSVDEDEITEDHDGRFHWTDRTGAYYIIERELES